jgi:hypothetical protein
MLGICRNECCCSPCTACPQSKRWLAGGLAPTSFLTLGREAGLLAGLAALADMRMGEGVRSSPSTSHAAHGRGGERREKTKSSLSRCRTSVVDCDNQTPQVCQEQPWLPDAAGQGKDKEEEQELVKEKGKEMEREIRGVKSLSSLLTKLVASLVDSERGEYIVVGRDPRLPLLLCPM